MSHSEGSIIYIKVKLAKVKRTQIVNIVDVTEKDLKIKWLSKNLQITQRASVNSTETVCKMA